MAESFLLKQKIKSKRQSSHKVENKMKQGTNGCIFIRTYEPTYLNIHNIVPDALSTHYLTGFL